MYMMHEYTQILEIERLRGQIFDLLACLKTVSNRVNDCSPVSDELHSVMISLHDYTHSMVLNRDAYRKLE